MSKRTIAVCSTAYDEAMEAIGQSKAIVELLLGHQDENFIQPDWKRISAAVWLLQERLESAESQLAS